tara:strand:+ start:929 stop:1258 length:330 start_codon:yes stop_codon:yes gene_type:complete
MKLVWEDEDIVCGLRVVNPERGEVGLIGYGYSDTHDLDVGKFTFMELNTDGFSFHSAEAKKVAKHLNKGWFPLSLFSGTGHRLIKYDGQFKNMRHLSKWNEITTYKTDQ